MVRVRQIARLYACFRIVCKWQLREVGFYAYVPMKRGSSADSGSRVSGDVSTCPFDCRFCKSQGVCGSSGSHRVHAMPSTTLQQYPLQAVWLPCLPFSVVSIGRLLCLPLTLPRGDLRTRGSMQHTSNSRNHPSMTAVLLHAPQVGSRRLHAPHLGSSRQHSQLHCLPTVNTTASTPSLSLMASSAPERMT